MLPSAAASADLRPRADVLAIHVMDAITKAHTEGRSITLASLVRELGVRKADLRDVVSRLHAQGFVDALRMRPTLLGFALGAATAPGLAPLRPERRTAVVAKAA